METQFDIIAEDLGYSGPPGGAGFGEWYFESYLNPGFNNIPFSGNQTRFISNDTAFTGPLPSSGTVAPWVLPTSPAVGSFSVFPGSIIELGQLTHPSIGVPNLAPDSSSRPLLAILPRYRPTSGTITLVSVSNYPVNLSSVSLTVNGVPFNLGQPGLPAPSIAAPVVSLSIPVTFPGFLPPPGTPARLRLTALEAGPAPAGIVFRTGINEVQY